QHGDLRVVDLEGHVGEPGVGASAVLRIMAVAAFLVCG
ncbi:MAG: hypothetical protein RLY71_4050, partial [Pseudomonadota bacterium]